MNLKGTVLSKEASHKKVTQWDFSYLTFCKRQNLTDEDQSRFSQALSIRGGCDYKGRT